MLQKIIQRFLDRRPLSIVREDLQGHASQGRPVIGVQHSLRDAQCAEGETYGHLTVYRSVPFVVGAVVDPQTAAFSVGLAVAGRGITLSFSPSPTQWITLGEWLQAPSKAPGAKLTELMVDQTGAVSWHLWAGQQIVGRLLSRNSLRRGRIDLAKKILGAPRHLEFHGKSRTRRIEMPEGTYKVQAVRRTVIETYRIGMFRHNRFVEITSAVGIPWPKDKQQALCTEFVAQTEDIGQAVDWWRADLLRKRPAGWTPKKDARQTGEENGVPVWSVRDTFTGEWSVVGPKPADQLPADWLVQPPPPLWLAAALGAGLIGMMAYGLGSLFQRKGKAASASP